MIRSASTKILASLLVFVMMFAAVIAILPPVEANAANIVITLDPGHGGKDPGATGASAFGGKSEAAYVLIFCNYMKERLQQYGGFTVHLTRTTDTFIELADRPTIAKNKGSDAFVSVHCNSAASASANGSEVYTAQSGASNYAASQRMASLVLNQLVSATGNKNRGVKTASYAVLNGAKNKGIPVGILIETGFVVNQGDYNRTFANDSILKKVAYAMADGIAQYYGKTGAGPLPEASSSYVADTSNDELRYLDAGGAQIGQAFAPGQYATWNKSLTIDASQVATLADWGWAAVFANSYQFGYVVNGKEIFKDSYTHTTEQPVKDVIASYGSGAKGSRFLGTLPTSELKNGENNVKFCVKLDGKQIETIREYTVIASNVTSGGSTTTPSTPTAKYWSSIDHINGAGANGAPHFSDRGGKTQSGADTINAATEKVAINGTTLEIGGWMALEGGISKYVYSLDGGKTWNAANGGANGEPQDGYFEMIGISNATKNAMFNMGGAPITIDLSAQAGKTVNITVAAVSATDANNIVPFVIVSNYAVPAPSVETQAPVEVVTEAPVEDVTEAPVEDATEAPAEYATEAPAEDATEAVAENDTQTVSDETAENAEEGNTEAVVEFVTTEDGELVTDENGELVPAEPQTQASTEEAPQGSQLAGCGAVLPSTAAVLALSALAGVVCLRKKKED